MYFEDISESLNLSSFQAENQITCVNGNVFLAVGHKKVVTFSSDMVCLSFKGFILKIGGEKLEIKQLEKQEIMITGKILSVNYEYGKF